ncbi:MAG: protein-export chaperone SecB [Pseudomonadota bacterium]
MADETTDTPDTSDASGVAPNGAGEDAAPPMLNIVTQYITDLSFENPNAPSSLGQQQGQPKIEIGVNVNAKGVGEDAYEVTLQIEANAKVQGEGADAEPVSLFATDLSYAGVFRIQNVPQENMHPLLLIECPRLLFPFARQIVAEATRNGGFPPLMLDPIDFAQLYRRRLAQAQAETAAKEQVAAAN